jgi:hypothetical protein
VNGDPAGPIVIGSPPPPIAVTGQSSGFVVQIPSFIIGLWWLAAVGIEAG